MPTFSSLDHDLRSSNLAVVSSYFGWTLYVDSPDHSIRIRPSSRLQVRCGLFPRGTPACSGTRTIHNRDLFSASSPMLRSWMTLHFLRYMRPKWRVSVEVPVGGDWRCWNYCLESRCTPFWFSFSAIHRLRCDLTKAGAQGIRNACICYRLGKHSICVKLLHATFLPISFGPPRYGKTTKRPSPNPNQTKPTHPPSLPIASSTSHHQPPSQIFALAGNPVARP